MAGIEIPISHMVGKGKVNQNQPIENQRSATELLRVLGSDSARSMADLMAAQVVGECADRRLFFRFGNGAQAQFFNVVFARYFLNLE
jgi:hypothetical protein